MKFLINNIEWTIKEADSFDISLIVNSERSKGTTHYVTSDITLCRELKEDVKRQTLAHELVHAFLYATQIEVPKEHDEEFICEFFARYGFQMLEIVNKYFEVKK